ncbi:MAG TPA: DUF4410 domain-containing protein [Steroidobacteraceae bacterium]|nr:DUF4410 domain-containing protein [Steroidobacteraceae bacterium]
MRHASWVVHSTITMALVALAGCASTAPKAHFSQQIVASAQVTSADDVQVNVTAGNGVTMLNEEKSRMAEKIKARIDARKTGNPAAGAARTFEVDVDLTRYDKGNAFARAMLIGLGQIHIDGKAQVYLLPAHDAVGEFDLRKTFAWGGLYGAVTSMDDIENTFADGVAAALIEDKSHQSRTRKGN